MRRTLALCLATWGTACGPSTPQTDILNTPDASEILDSGVVEPLDAAEDMGAGPPKPLDAGQDVGQDAARPLLERWFEDYNAGQGTDYIDAQHTTNASGDPRYAQAPAHEHREGVAYGPFPRNELDLWLVRASEPAPIAVYIHGGGFQSGSKDNVHRTARIVPRLLEAGVSVASISYRYAYRDPEAALRAEIPNGEGSVHDVNGARLDYILRDCARAIQYLRYRAAEWGIDPERIGAWGGSAGAGCATWTGAVDDLAQPDHADPVLRESTRLKVVGHTNGQPTYSWLRWPELLQMEADFVFGLVEGEAVRLTQISLEGLRDTEQGQQLGQVLDYYEHLGPQDPPFYTQNARPDLDETMITSGGEVIHHPRAHVALYQRCVDAGLMCEIDTPILRSGYMGDVVQFMIDHLQR